MLLAIPLFTNVYNVHNPRKILTPQNDAWNPEQSHKSVYWYPNIDRQLNICKTLHLNPEGLIFIESFWGIPLWFAKFGATNTPLFPPINSFSNHWSGNCSFWMQIGCNLAEILICLFQTQSVICCAMLCLGGFCDAMRHLDDFNRLFCRCFLPVSNDCWIFISCSLVTISLFAKTCFFLRVELYDRSKLGGSQSHNQILPD